MLLLPPELLSAPMAASASSYSSIPPTPSTTVRSSPARFLAVSAAGDAKEHKGSPVGSNVREVSSKLKACSLLSVASIATTSVQPAAASAPPQELFGILHSLTLADLDPATARVAAGIAGPALSAFGFLFILRIIMSWYPKLPVGEFPYVVAYAPTEPLLSVTRRVIPPVGGVDVTPVVWFGLVSFMNEILAGPQGLLVLLSQQQQVQ